MRTPSLRAVLAILGALALGSPLRAQLHVLDVHRLHKTGYWNPCVKPYLGGQLVIGLKASYPPTVERHDYIARAILQLGWSDVSGYTADGASLLLLAYKASEPGCVTFEVFDGGTQLGSEASVGRVRNSFDKEDVGNGVLVYTRTLAYQVPGSNQVLEEDWAFAELLAPENFVRNSADENLRTRPIRIEASFQEMTDCGTSNFPVPPQFANIQLYRPPVVMVHGIFSNKGMWNETAWQSFFGSPAYPGSDVLRVDYSKNLSNVPGFPFTETVQQNAMSFAANRWVVPMAIIEAVAKRRGSGVATTKVDLIGHSMGGVLARLFAENGHPYPNGVQAGYLYRRPDNFRLGDIHKLITLDSPHQGSHWADLIDLIASNPIAKAAIKTIGAWLAMPPFQGAAMDMRSYSHNTQYMRDAEVPAHALVGTGGRSVSSSMSPTARKFLLDHYFWFIGPGAVFVPALVPLDLLINGPLMFNGLEHDTVVSEPSQLGGLGGAHSSVFAAPPWEMTHTSFGSVPALCLSGPPCWVGVGSSPIMAARFLGLLHASVAGSSFAAKFPGTGLTPPPSPPPPSPPPPTGGGAHTPATPVPYIALEILAPLANASFPGGSSVAVKVRPIPGFTPQYLGIFVGGQVHEPPFDPTDGTYNAVVTIPLAALGTVTIHALGLEQNSGVATASVAVNATLPAGATLVGISVDPFPLELWNASPPAQLNVHGIYTDVQRDLTHHAGTSYVSQNPAIAVVSATGLVTGVALGVTQVTVSHAGFVQAVGVFVHEVKGDYDGDGDVDNQDFGAFMACFTGPIEAPSYETTGNVCLSTFDFDGDVDVDADDYALFLTAFTGTLGLDCNGNGMDDMHDIFGGLSTDCDHDGVPDECGSTDCNGNGIADSCDIEPKNFGFDDPQSHAGAATVVPRTVAVGDFDGDGDRDVAVCHPGSAIGVHRNLGNGVFTSAVGNGGLPIPTQATSIAAANLDGVGGDELLVCADNASNSNGDYLVVMKNCVNGAFQDTHWFPLPGGMPSGAGPRAVVAGLFTGDTKPDVAIAMGTLPTISPTGGKVFVLVNTSTASTISFSASVNQYNAQGGARALVTTDVDRDGKLDLAVANYNSVTPTHSVVILRGNGNGTFNPAGTRTTFTAFGAPLALAAGDMNGDGWPEIAVANETSGDVDLLVNVGVASTLQFTLANDVAHTQDPRAMVAGDLDGDGRSDLVVADAALGGIQVLRMLCLGCRFWGTAAAEEFAYLTPSAPRGVALGDFDGDGDLDVATANVAPSGQSSPVTSFLRNHVSLPTSFDADADGVPDECAPDCNNNGKFDTCDIALGLLADCNQNLLADLCEPLGPRVDCNANGLIDACEISSGAAMDCDQNGVIDACQMAAGAPDCNANGALDSCDVASLYSQTSPVIHDIFWGSPQSHTFLVPPPATNDPSIPVTLRFAANADFAAAVHRIQIRLNSTIIGDAYTGSYWGCDSPYGPDLFTMTLSPAYYNSIKGTGNVVITMTPTGTAQTGMQQCIGPPSWIQLTLEYSDAHSLDLNQNGIPDECPGG